MNDVLLILDKHFSDLIWLSFKFGVSVFSSLFHILDHSHTHSSIIAT